MTVIYFNISRRLNRLNYFLVPFVNLCILCAKCTQFILHKNRYEKQRIPRILADYNYCY